MNGYVTPLANGVTDFEPYRLSEHGFSALSAWAEKHQIQDFKQMNSEVLEALTFYKCAYTLEQENRGKLLRATKDESLSEYRKLLRRRIQLLNNQLSTVIGLTSEIDTRIEPKGLSKLLSSLTGPAHNHESDLLWFSDASPIGNLAAQAQIALYKRDWKSLTDQLRTLIGELESIFNWATTTTKGGPNPDLAKHRLAADLKRILNRHGVPTTTTHEHGKSGSWNSLIHLVLTDLGQSNSSGDYTAYMN